MQQDHRLVRGTPYSLELPHEGETPIELFATPEVPLETSAVDELLAFAELESSVRSLASDVPEFFGDREPVINRIAVTPDFHKGAGIPIGTVLQTEGFVVPQAIGNDINCGMRLMTTPLERSDVDPEMDRVEAKTREGFFEGRRQLPMTPGQREAMVRRGLPGLLDHAGEAGGEGLWGKFDADKEREALDHVHAGGGFETDGVFALEDYLAQGRKLSYDNLIGGLGGGNHFAELQYVKEIHDGAIAHAWGLKRDQVVLMIHCGSLGLGHVTGRWFQDQIRRVYPEQRAHPSNGIYPLPIDGPHAGLFEAFMISMRNAANFAFGNRFFLAQMLRESLAQAIGPFPMDTLYDAPHNLLWEAGDGTFIHRKGASPAHGFEAMDDTPFLTTGEPVIVPGSMGASSWILAGRGCDGAISSSCHGAGRALSRNDAAKVDDAQLDAFLEEFRVVTPVDPQREDIKRQGKIIEAWREALKKEAPFAYKSITPVIETLRAAGMAEPVAELHPLMTVKG